MDSSSKTLVMALLREIPLPVKAANALAKYVLRIVAQESASRFADLARKGTSLAPRPSVTIVNLAMEKIVTTAQAENAPRSEA